jgi:hypothetical protein
MRRSKSTSCQRSARALFGLRPRKNQHRDYRAILAGGPVDEPLRLFQLERSNVGLRFAEILNELHRVFVNELAAFCDREDRPQSCDDLVDPTQPERLPTAGLSVGELADEEMNVAVVHLVDSLLPDRRGKEQRLDEPLVIVGGCEREDRAALLEPRFCEFPVSERLLSLRRQVRQEWVPLVAAAAADLFRVAQGGAFPESAMHSRTFLPSARIRSL